MHRLLTTTCVGIASTALAQTTVYPTAQYAYGANIGWLTWRPSSAEGVRTTETYLTGHAYAANVGWITFGSGQPNNGYAYSNGLASDWGVNLTRPWHLVGFAYGANIGWIQFEQTHGQPRLDPATGNLTGHAWSANVGWIALATVQSALRTNLACPDTDGDGLADAYEWRHFNNLTTANATTDADRDGALDIAEYGADTLPTDAASRLCITAQAYTGSPITNGVLTFRSEPTRQYYLDHSTTLISDWQDSGLGLILPALGPTTTVSVTFPTGPRRYFRVRARKPLPDL